MLPSSNNTDKNAFQMNDGHHDRRRRRNNHQQQQSRQTQLLPELAAEEAAMQQQERMSQLQMELEQQERLVNQLRTFRDLRMDLTSQVAEMMTTNENSRGLIRTRQLEVEQEKTEKGIVAAELEVVEQNYDDEKFEDDIVSEEEESKDQTENEAQLQQENLLDSVLKGMMNQLSHIQATLKNIEKENLEQVEKKTEGNALQSTFVADENTQKEQQHHVDPTSLLIVADSNKNLKQDENENSISDSSPYSSPNGGRLGFGFASVRVIDRTSKPTNDDQQVENVVPVGAVNEDLVEEDEEIVVVRDDE